MMVRRVSQIFLLNILLCLSACASLQQISENAFLITPAEEAELGKEIAKEVEKNYTIYEGDAAATDYINRLGQRLVRSAPPCEQAFHFSLVESDEVNAFAIPGGFCYVQIGLIRASETEAELAGVLAHEIGHVVARHGAKSISQSQFYGALSEIALGEDSSAMAGYAAGIWKSGVLLQYGRTHELQADSISVQTLHRAGINPNGLVTFFEKLQAESRGNTGSKLGQYFSTHPLTGERISRARQQIRALGAGVVAPPGEDSSREFRLLKLRYPALP